MVAGGHTFGLGLGLGLGLELVIVVVVVVVGDHAFGSIVAKLDTA